MNKVKIKQIEDIYPLTIVRMRFGGTFVIFNMSSDNEIVNDVQEDEEVHYQLESYLEEKLSPSCYGIGETIYDAFLDYQRRYYNY